MTRSGGYKDQKLNKDLYRVVAKGNSNTDSEMIYDIFIRRCAEVTIANDHQFFTFVSSDKESQTSIVAGHTTGNRTPYGRRFDQRYGGGFENYNATTSYSSVTRYSREGIIRTFKKGDQPKVSFNASQILQNTDYLNK